MKKMIFLEGLPGVGKTTIINSIRNLNLQNVHVVEEIINPIEEKTPVNQISYFKNDEMKLSKYGEDIVIIDRGPISTLSKDYNGECYQFDCSPFVGYKCGKVELVTVERFYEEYYPIEGEIEEILYNIRLIQYDIHKTGKTDIDVNYFIHKAIKYPILQGYVLELKELLKTSKVSSKENKTAKKKLSYQIEEWKRELKQLIQSNENFSS